MTGRPGPSTDPFTDYPTVLAAGVVCWRPARGGTARDQDPDRAVEVVLVHRPRLEDWSLPKGKLEPGETLPECAVRETLEETGTEVVLGRSLPPVAYQLPDGRPKEVHYWSATPVATRTATAAPSEVDQVAWLALGEARARLSHDGDRAQLVALAELIAEGTLDSRPLLVIRHVTARPRDAWARADADRPLVASGRRQSLALASLLRCWRPEQLLSSPWRRCLETLGPYVAASGAKLRTKGGLSEDGFQRDPGKARRHTERLLGKEHPTGMCTHRPVLPSVLDAIRAHALPEVGKTLPDTDPYLAPGEVLVAHVVTGKSGRPSVIAIERHTAPR